MIRAEIGAGNFSAIERVAELVSTLDAQQASPSAMCDFPTELPTRLGSPFSDLLDGFSWTNLANQLVNAAKDQLTSSIAQILPRIAEVTKQFGMDCA